MIDKHKRRHAAALVAQLRSGAITNDQFQAAYPPRSRDRALFAVFMDVWSSYDDLREHRLDDLSEPLRLRLQRCELFLGTDLAYEWPGWFLSVPAFLLWPVHLLTLGMLGRFLRRRFDRAGDADVWPFLRSGDFDAARASIRADLR